MPYVCLLLSGAALLINGLATVGHLPRRDAAVLSLVVGILQLVLGVVLSPGPSAGGPLTASGMFLFGLTYLYVGLDFLLDLGSKGLGWFCGMAAFVGLLLAAAWLREDPLLSVLWLGWSVLWGLFFVSMAMGLARVDQFTGWALVLTSQASATVPGVLGLAGLWPHSPSAAAAAAVFLAALFFIAGILARRTLAAQERARTDAVAPDRALRQPLNAPAEGAAR